MKYFKFFNKDENHHGFQYKDGLNTDTLPFNDNPEDSCCPGGLYFADAANIMDFFEYSHVFVREITIPAGGLVVPDMDDKFRAHSIILGERHDLFTLETWVWLVSNGVVVTSINNYAIKRASENGHLEVVKFLVENGADATGDNNWAIQSASKNGHLDVVKFLVEHGADVTADDNWAIVGASENGHLEVVKFLVGAGASVTANDNYAVKSARASGHRAVVEYLLTQGAKL